MTTVRSYTIMRKGAQVTRWEDESGKPWKGDRYQHTDPSTGMGEYVAIRGEDGKPVKLVKRTYGYKQDIKLSEAGAAALAHLNLVPKIAGATAPIAAKSDDDLRTMAETMVGRPVASVAEAREVMEKFGVTF